MVNFEFDLIELDSFPALVTREFFGKQKPDNFAFLDPFFERFEQKFGPNIEQIQLYNGGAARSSLAFVYLNDLTILGVEFTDNPNLTSWFVAMAASFDGSSTHKITSSGLNGSRFSKWDELLQAPASWAQKHAPKSHFKAEFLAEKTKFFAFKSVAPKPGSATHLPTAFQALLNARALQATPPNLTDLDALERAVGVPLPHDFKALYAATGAIKELFYGFDLLSAKEATTQHASWTAIYNDWILEDLQSQQSAEAGIHPVYCTPRWIPFVDLMGGNYLAIDLAPAKNGTYGQVITFGRDVDRKRLIAKNLTDFLQKAATYDGSEKHELYSVLGQLKLS